MTKRHMVVTGDRETKIRKTDREWREGREIDGPIARERRGDGVLGFRAGQHRMKDEGRGWSNGNDEWPVAHQRSPGWCAKIRF